MKDKEQRQASHEQHPRCHLLPTPAYPALAVAFL